MALFKTDSSTYFADGVTSINLNPVSLLIISVNVDTPVTDNVFDNVVFPFIVFTPELELIFSVPPLVKLLNKLIVPFKLFGVKILIGDAPVRFKVGLKISQLAVLSVKLFCTAPTDGLVFNLIVEPRLGFSIFKVAEFC